MEVPAKTTARNFGTLVAGAGFTLALASGIAALLAGLGTRWGWWDFRGGFQILRCAVWCGMAASAISVYAVAIALRDGLRHAIVFGVHGLIIGALVWGVPLYLVNEGRKLPPIHDITTDTEQPPSFIAVIPLRKDAANTTEYGGSELAEQQKKAYPDIEPAVLPLAPRAAFELALAIARMSGWEIVSARADDDRIEATATTDWFGFKDDIVIRIKPAGSGSRVDIRSASRVGRSDLGANARRIREFLRQLNARKAG